MTELDQQSPASAGVGNQAPALRAPAEPTDGRAAAQRNQHGGVRFFPEHMFKEAVVMVGLIALIMLLGQIIPLPKEKVADPSDTAYIPRPEWYFLFLFQLLKYFPGQLEVVAIVLVPAISIGYLILLPFIDRGPVRHPFKRPVFTGLGILGLAGIVTLTALAMMADSGFGKSSFFQQWKIAVLVGIILLNYAITWMMVIRKGSNQDPIIRNLLAGGMALLSVVGIVTIMVMTAITPATAPEAAAVSPGERLFRENCMSCHAFQGEGGGPGGAPDLSKGTRKGADFVKKYLKDPKAVNPEAGMPAAKLADDQIALVAEFLADVGAKSGGGQEAAGPPNPEAAAAAALVAQGKKLVADKNCAYCHKVSGQGGMIGPELTKVGGRRDQGWLKVYLADPQSAKPGAMMPKIELTKEQVDAVAAYLGSLK